MTLGDWLEERAEGVPPHLMSRVRDALGSDVAADAVRGPEACVAAAVKVVGELLDADQIGRESALSLLAADALATFAFEAAADDPARIASRAHAAMHALATGT